MRILYLTEIYPDPRSGLGYWGGGERGFYELARRAVKFGHRATVLTCRFPGQVGEDQYEGVEIRRAGLSRNPVTGGVLKSPLRVADYLRRTTNAAAKIDFDIVHCNTYYPVLAGRLASWVRGTAMVSTFHDLPGLGSWQRYVESPAWGAAGYALTAATARLSGEGVIAVSEQTKVKLESLGVKDVEVIPNGIDVDLLDSNRGSRKDAQILYIGRLVQYKRVDILIRAMAVVLRKVPRARLVIVGDGPERKKLVGLAQDLKISGAVVFTGNIPSNEEVARIYSESTVFALPSVLEGEGIVLKEAMGARLPVVATNVPGSGVLSVVRDGWNGLLVKPGEEEPLAQSLLALISSPERREEMGRHGREGVEKWTWDEVAERVFRIYRASLEKGLR